MPDDPDSKQGQNHLSQLLSDHTCDIWKSLGVMIPACFLNLPPDMCLPPKPHRDFHLETLWLPFESQISGSL